MTRTAGDRPDSAPPMSVSATHRCGRWHTPGRAQLNDPTRPTREVFRAGRLGRELRPNISEHGALQNTVPVRALVRDRVENPRYSDI